MGEATATVQRVSRKGHQEAHTGSLVLQAAATGAPLDLLSRSLRLQLPAGRGVSEGPAHWRPRLPQTSNSGRSCPATYLEVLNGSLMPLLQPQLAQMIK